jgi:hypothetical protein
MRILTAAIAVTTTVLAATAALSAPVSAAANNSWLNPGESLRSGQRLVSADGQYVLAMQGDGNLVAYAPGNRAVWATGTNRPGSDVQMQGDGNLVIVDRVLHPAGAQPGPDHGVGHPDLLGAELHQRPVRLAVWRAEVLEQPEAESLVLARR